MFVVDSYSTAGIKCSFEVGIEVNWRRDGKRRSTGRDGLGRFVPSGASLGASFLGTSLETSLDTFRRKWWAEQVPGSKIDWTRVQPTLPQPLTRSSGALTAPWQPGPAGARLEAAPRLAIHDPQIFDLFVRRAGSTIPKLNSRLHLHSKLLTQKRSNILGSPSLLLLAQKLWVCSSTVHEKNWYNFSSVHPGSRSIRCCCL